MDEVRELCLRARPSTWLTTSSGVRTVKKVGQFNNVKPPLLRRPYFFFAFLAFLAAFFAFFAIVPPEGGCARAKGDRALWKRSLRCSQPVA